MYDRKGQMGIKLGIVQLGVSLIMNHVIIIYFILNRAMKPKLYQLVTTLLIFVYQAQSITCDPPFTSVSSSQVPYCVKCDSTCATCFDDSLSGCVTCPDDFNLNQNTSYCLPPNTKLIHTIQSSYKYYKFTQYGNWSGGSPTDCGMTTVLTAGPGGIIQTTNYLGKHYGMRILVSVWWLNQGASVIDKITIKGLLPDGVTAKYDHDILFSQAKSSSSNNSQYCTASYATNHDSGVFNGDSSTYLTVKFTSTSTSWGIREYVFIQYLCNVTWCATCTGPDWNDCVTCTDPRRIAAGFNGECRCNARANVTFGYYKHPDADYCVWPCPSKPGTGQYYGDQSTQTCVTQCPANTSNSARDGVMYSDDVSGECVPECPATITHWNQTKDLFHDVDNRRCVTNCPTSKPYKDTVNRKCVATCPSTYYKYDKDMTCVNACPTNIEIPLYKDDFLGKCVDDCEGADWWADPTTNKCTATCNAANKFEDNSTTRNRCTAVCPAPTYFGDLFTGKCIDHCYGGKFGNTDPSAASASTYRQCVVQCPSGYYGLLTGNRACVTVCPNQTWAQDTNRTCKLQTTDCPSTKYADNYTHKCVAKGACSLGQFSTDVGTKCVITCPSGTFADPSTKHCQTACTNSLFADSTSNKCVSVCEGPNLYADVGSSYKCVTRCNQSTTTKYKDFSTKRCVAICPDDPYTFSDPDAQACVYNCSIGRYKDDLTTPANKKCVTNCPSPNWGDNSTGYGQCVRACPQNPPLFGDIVDGGFRICVQVCQDLAVGVGLFGDQRPIGSGVNQGYRQCIPVCPGIDGTPYAAVDYFAQSDDLRRCVTRCNASTYGDIVDQVCKLPQNCPDVGDPSTNLCVTTVCPASQGTFADDIVSNLCVQRCPVNNSILYFADPVGRRCRATCTSPKFGNNLTQTCQTNCIDFKAFADSVHPNRFCILNCTESSTQLYYRNNQTKTCVLAMSCQTGYFGDNVTKNCVAKCPVKNGAQTWGNPPSKTCVTKCYIDRWGDASSGVPLCVLNCSTLPAKWSYNPTMLCVSVCPASDGLWGWDYNRSCVSSCIAYPTTPQTLVYAFNGTNNQTRRCLEQCPQGYFADYLAKMCWSNPANCTAGWGDDFNNSCTTLCTGPNPWNTFGDNLTHLCTTRCSVGSFADNQTGTRICVLVCPGTYDATGVNTNAYDTFGDNNTQSCVRRCMMPNTWADWQTHRCQLRCKGDGGVGVSTYAASLIYRSGSTVSQNRCVIALWCPQTPDKLFADNNTRSCQRICFFNDTYIEWADNITRTCIPQCLNFSKSPAVSTNQYTQPNGTVFDTRFYGDNSTKSPQCVVICPQSPRMFGKNSTNRCVSQCPTDQYGDQTGNRSCVPYCPTHGGIVWFTQIHEHICVKVCEDGTWGNFYHGPNDRPHCQVTPLGCQQGWYADNSTHMCIPLCPETQNYFGDNSTRLCVDRCPTLASPVVIPASNINMAAGHTYADYQTRMCVYRCPDNFGPFGTFGDNDTNTCVHRCPDGTFGDAQTTNRHCVVDCKVGTFADPLSQTCVSECPASPPYFGQRVNWTCVQNCPNGTWASASTRTCQSTCPPNQFRLTDERTQCVDVCPSDPDLYGDPQTHDCVSRCDLGTSYPFADPTDRTCKSSCSPLFQYNYRCVKLCPSGYYANSTNNCVPAIQCDGTTYADNRTTKCIRPCVGGSFADTNTKYCVAICPDTYYGDVDTCVQTCQTPGTSKSNITQTCRSTCPNLTYHQNNTCKPKCQYGYANDVLGSCAPGCPPNLYADPLTHDCVADCYDNQTNNTHDWFRNTSNGFCVNDCGDKFKDFITGNCQAKCSPGYWGNTHNMTCIQKCIEGQYGYEGANQRTCYDPTVLPGYASSLFGDPVSGEYVSVCPTAPQLYFGDSILHECKLVCPSHASTDYYGDPNTRQCEPVCTNATFYTADPSTFRCQVRCSSGTFRYNDTPICVDICPVGYADQTTMTCVAVCPVWADTFGFFNTTSTQRICMMECPNNFYAQPVYRTCSATCSAPLFAYNITHQCVNHCIDSFADSNNHRCMDKCHSAAYPNADNSTNRCVFQCPSVPDYYSDNHVCVYYCTNSLQFADPDTRSCVGRCPNVTVPSAAKTYGDPTTGRCVKKCPLGYFADNTTNKCVKTCPSLSFGYNGSRTCVNVCPSGQKLYGDPFTHMCAFTCSNNYYGSQVNQQCIGTCDLDYWGDPLSTMCVSTCPGVRYLFGQNDTRTCVASCVGYSGFADNMTRICRDVCQNLSTWLTFADPTTMSCVEMCPDTYFMQNTTNQCLQQCLTGNADNYSRFCVLTCPDQPQSYADTTLHICVYECLRGQFSDNSTNQCVPQCPSNPEYYGDPTIGKCVFYCSEGLWAQTSSRRCVPQCSLGQYADNYTRRCVSKCPASQQTYGHYLSRKCLRVCPVDFWADNSTQECVSNCPDIVIGGNTVDTYADNITHYCVLTCPAPNFGRKDTNRCVRQCPLSANLFGHHVGRICVGVLNCFAVGGVQYYSDDVSRQCVQKCPISRWADLSLNKCVFTCPPSYYRNIHDQTCVSNCPTDPDQYADTLALNCTRKCPNGYYAVVDNTGFRVCASECLTHGLIKDNITNRCVALTDCPTDPFMFGDWNAGACVYHCSILYFADNKTRTCVYTCPASWELFGSLDTYQCVQLCDNYLYADQLYSNRPRTCRSSCSNGYFADNQTSRCVQRCSSIKPFYYQDIPSGKCVQICPDQSYAYNTNQTCIYSTMTASGYVSHCPGAYFADPLSRTCVKLCPIGYFATTSTKYCAQTCTGLQFADNQTRTCTTVCSNHTFSLDVNTSAQVCVQFCPYPYFAQNSTKSCATGCTTLLALQTTRSCQNYCPQPYFAQWSLHKCVRSCNPKFADLQSRRCITPCVAPSYSNPINYTCDLICPPNHFGRNSTRSCATTCLIGFADPYSRICVTQCPVSPMLFADTRGNLCVQICLTPRFAYDVDRTCVLSCPNASGLVYLADSSNRKCVLQCTNQVLSYADYQNNLCTAFCPAGRYASNLTKQCVPVCDNSPNDTFSDNITHICMDICKQGTFGFAPTLNCVDQCWWPLFGQPNTRLCVLFCPDGLFAQNQTARCTPTCQPGTYADPTTNRCVRDCPQAHDLYKFSNWTCLASCPTGYYANRNISQCVAICNSMNGMYAYEQTHECVMQCPYPYRGYQPTHTCVTSCPSLYFYNISRNVCTRCPLQCLTCTGPLSCLSCVGGYNLFNGQCSSSCRPNGAIITYAHPTTNLCVGTCPNGFFGNNQTYVCSLTCPTKQYGSTTTNVCQNCPRTCAQCTSLTYCSSCESNATMAIDHMCYSHCNATHPYAYNNTCYLTCPAGTFISYTNVHCTQCSDLCKTCSSNASYCLSCYDRYLYNHACIAQCPSGYYGATDFTCQPCTSATTAICAEPLTFTTQVNIQNYQYVVSIKFNQEVSIQKQIQQILKVSLKVTRRLVSAADLINNGLKYTYKILSDGTIKLYLEIGIDLVNPVFTVRFTDPTAITSLVNGATLQDIDSQFHIEKVEYYPPEDSTQLGIRKAALFTVVFILLLYCLTVLFTDVMVKPIQMLQILFFHCICDISMSASFFFFFLQLKPALLQFLPNWMALPLAKDITLHDKSSQKTIDVFVDFNFFRNVGHVVFMILIGFGLWALFMILSNRRVIENKVFHNLFQFISIRRFRFSVLNDILSVLYVPILWFGLNQFQQLFSTGYLGFNGFICLIFVIVCLLLPVGLFFIYFRKQKQEIIERFPFMTNRINVQKQRSILQTPVTYVYLLMSVIWLVGLDKNSVPQMIMLILTNSAYLVYMVVSRPFSIHVNTIFGVLWCAMLIVIQIFLLFFEINNLTMISSQKTKMAYPLLITVSVIFMMFIIWCVWRSVWQLMDIWKTFKQTQFYKTYGDPEIQNQSEQSQVYNKYEKAVINQQPTLGDIIIQKVFKQCNQKGQNVIKVRKKVLKKKKKVRGRGKRPAEQQQQQEKQFVRINQVNPFDYDYDDTFKQKQTKQPMKRVFDDDLRQIMSDQEEKPIQKSYKKPPSKLPKLTKFNQNLRKIKVQSEQKRISNIDQLLNDQSQNIQSFKQQSKQDSGEYEKESVKPTIKNEQPIYEKRKENEPKLYRQNSSQFYRQNSGQFYRENSSQFLINQSLRRSSGNNDSFSKIESPIKQDYMKQPQLQSIKQSELEDYKNLNSDRYEQQQLQKKRQSKYMHRNESNHQIWENFDLQNEINEVKIQSPNQSVQVIEESQKIEQTVQKQQKQQQIQQQQKKEAANQKPKGIQQLIQQQEGNKKKKLLFLFDELQDD